VTTVRAAFLSTDLTTIYLNDHLAGATTGHELARRTLGANRGTEFEPVLTELAQAIEEDKAELERLMNRLDIDSDPLKRSAGWLAEKIGRLKFNGSLTSYSPLSRLIEFEGLTAGVGAKLSLWRTLRQVASHDPRLDVGSLERLIGRAKEQLDRLAGIHTRAAELALAPGTGAGGAA
jgi:hypothetical protein